MSKLVVSIPTDRLENDVRQHLGDDVLDQVEFIRWTMEQPTARDRIDLVVPPYMSVENILPHLESVRTQLVQSQSIGYDGVQNVLPAGHVFANASSVHETATSELALALTLAAQRQLPQYVRNQEQAVWKARFAPSLADRRVTVLGYGGVGKAVVSRLEPFETNITVVASHAREEDGQQVHGIDELSTLLPTTDVLILTLPASDSTIHIINDAALSALPDGALVVNVGRGSLIDTDALVHHVEQGRIRAALDVTDPEPLPADHPLWKSAAVLITPHVGGLASSMQPRIAKLIASQITRLLAHEAPINVVVTS